MFHPILFFFAFFSTRTHTKHITNAHLNPLTFPLPLFEALAVILGAEPPTPFSSHPPDLAVFLTSAADFIFRAEVAASSGGGGGAKIFVGNK